MIGKRHLNLRPESAFHDVGMKDRRKGGKVKREENKKREERKGEVR